MGEKAGKFSEEESIWVEHEWAEGSFCQALVLFPFASVCKGPGGF